MITLQSAFAFDDVDFIESQVIAKEHTQKAYVTKAGVSKPAKLVPAKVTGALFRPMTVKEYQTANPDLTLAACKGQRGSEMIHGASAVIEDLYALKGSLALFRTVKRNNGHVILDFGPIPDGAAKVTADSALAFIQNNPEHPAVVAYLAQLKGAVAVTK